ncbi:MAG TPA: hypothetical protein VMA36_16285 [Candidatus Limnocylindria bacterium]|nr:hypothetical protein [Candidatus Limnocylindria bacterium]
MTSAPFAWLRDLWSGLVEAAREAGARSAERRFQRVYVRAYGDKFTDSVERELTYRSYRGW